MLLYKPLIKLRHLQRQDEPRRSGVVECNAHLVELSGVAQLVALAEAEAS
ncbi:MAG: hypothetical protein ACRYFV_14855 [Janthinobacterium lividum]